VPSGGRITGRSSAQPAWSRIQENESDHLTVTSVRLSRATVATSPYFGFRSCWAATLEHVQRYTRMLGFGGPVIYVVEVDVKCSEIWDLTGDVVSKMARREIELLSQGEGVSKPEEILHYGETRAKSMGHRWWLYDVDEPGGGVCWLYLGRDPLPAYPLNATGESSAARPSEARAAKRKA